LYLARLYSSFELSLAPMAPKKHIKTTVASSNRAQAARGNASLPHVINKYDIVFMNVDHTKPTSKVVIAAGGIITALGRALRFDVPD